MNSCIPKPSADEEALKAKGRELAITQGCFYGIMDGFGVRFISPFAIALGASNRAIGLLGTLSGLLANLCQLFTLPLMKHWTRKKITFWAVLAQICFWPLIMISGALHFIYGLDGISSGWVLLVCYTLLALSAAMSGPAWASWTRDLLPADVGAYMGRRSRNAGMAALASMLVAGLLLDRFKTAGLVFAGFTTLFGIAMTGRILCLINIRRIHEPAYVHNESVQFTFFQFVRRMGGNNYGRFVLYVSLFSLTTQISGPFGSVYLLRDLKLSYAQFTAITVVNALFAFSSYPLWGRFADRYGNLKAIRITGWIIPFIPFLWLVCPLIAPHSTTGLVAYLMAFFAFSGLVWAGFEIGAGNFIFHAVTPQRMAICATYAGILNGSGALLGGLIGGYITSLHFTFFGLSPILFVFILSGVLRLVVFLIMHSKIREVRQVETWNFVKARTSLVNFVDYFRPDFIRRPGER